MSKVDAKKNSVGSCTLTTHGKDGLLACSQCTGTELQDCEDYIRNISDFGLPSGGASGPGPIEKTIRDVIYAIFVTPMAKLALLGASVMDKFIDPQQFNDVFSSDNSKWMYSFWSLVRDILNIFLVLVLLLSAFSTDQKGQSR